MGMDELVDQARLPHTRLTNDGHRLAMARPSLRERLLQGRQLLLASHEARQPARRTGLQAPADRTDPDQLKDLHRVRQPLDWKPPQGVDLDQTLGQSEGRRRQPDTAWGGELFHTRRQVGGLPHGRIVHVQVVANRPHDDFPRIEPHARLQLQAVGPADLLGIAVRAVCMARAA